MKKIILAIAVVALMAFVAASQAADVTLLSRGSNGKVKPATDVHYTVMDQSGNMIANETVTTEKAPVQIADLPNGKYLLSVEEPSSGNFGNTTITVSPEAEGVVLVLDEDGLKEYGNDDVAGAAIAPTQPQTVAPAAPATPVQPAPYQSPMGGGIGALGALGLGAGVAGLVCGVVAMADNDESVSNEAH